MRIPSMLRLHDFLLLWTGETASMIGSAATVVALPLVAITVLDASPLVLGVLTACAWLPWPLLVLPAGAWIDQAGRRKVMLAGNLVSAAVFATVPVAAWAGVLSVAQLVAVTLAGGAARVFLSLAFQAYVPTVVPRAKLGPANSWIGASEATSEVAGPGLAGLLAALFTAVAGVAVDAATFVFSAVCLWRIRATEAIAERRSNDGLLARIGAGFRYTLGDRWLRTIAAYVALVNLTQAAVQTLLVVFLVSTVGVSGGTAGLLMASMGVGGLLGARLAVPAGKRFGTARTLLWGEAFTVPFALLMPAVADGLWIGLFAIGMIVVFAGLSAGSILARSFRQGYVPDAMLGRSAATMALFGRGAIPVGALAGGWLASTVGVHLALRTACIAMLVPVLVLLVSPIRGVRDLPVAAAEEPATQA